MAWTPLTPEWARPALAQLARVPHPHRGAIAGAVSRYAATGAGRVKQLQGRPELSLRVGRYRVLFINVFKTARMIVTRVAHRKDAYD